jgi:peptidoglycan biosynthesis protein MviN/MurJ (putative lipid II flippase)
MTGVPAERLSPARATAGVGLGLLVTNLLSAVQALLLVALVHDRAQTDGFLAAYSLYTPIALFGVSLRVSLVPLLASASQGEAGQQTERVLAQMGRVTLMVAVAGLALVLPLAAFLSRDLPPAGHRTVLLTLLLLLPAACLQIHVGTLSSVLNVRGRFPRSIAFYALAGIVGIAGSAAMLPLVGAIGAALGLLGGALALTVAHRREVRRLGLPLPALARRPPSDRRALTVHLLAGSSLVLGQQVNLAIALSALSHTAGAITLYSYGYFLVGLLLNATATAISLVTLPGLVASFQRSGGTAAHAHLRAISPYLFAVLLPLLAALAAFAQPLVAAAFRPVLDGSEPARLAEAARLLALVALPMSLLVVTGPVLLSMGRRFRALGVSLVGIALHAGLIYGVGGGLLAGVAVAHAVASGLTVVLLLIATFGRQTPTAVVVVARAALPACALAGVVVLVRLALPPATSSAPALAALVGALLAYALLTLWLRPTVARPFLRLVPLHRVTRPATRAR